MVKLQEVKTKNGSQFTITLPKSMILKKGWVKGQDLSFLFNERGNIEIME